MFGGALLTLAYCIIAMIGAIGALAFILAVGR